MRGIKRHVFSMGNLLPSTIIADAGSDQTVGSMAAIALDGTGSTTTDGGGISGYLWEIIEGGDGYTLTTPTASTSGVTGFPSNGSFVVRLTVTDATGNSASDTVSITVAVVVPTLAISSSLEDSNGRGTIDITGGGAAEDITLEFLLQGSDTGNGVVVRDGLLNVIPVGDLDWNNTLRYGQVTLDGSGDFTMTYDGSGSNPFSMKVTMRVRSTGGTIPSPGSTTVDFNF